MGRRERKKSTKARHPAIDQRMKLKWISRDVPQAETAAGLDDARRLRAAIARLTPIQQDIVILRFLEERSTKEVAQLTGKPESTVRGIQMRALAALRQALQSEDAR